MPTKDGWSHQRDHDKIQLGRKQYRNMEEWSRPCAVCGEPFSIFTRANGSGVVNSSFGLRTCQSHRGERPGAAGTPATGEVEGLRTANATMREELDGLYGVVRDLRDRLAKYELGPAMAAQASTAREEWNRVVEPAQAENKMPWEA